MPRGVTRMRLIFPLLFGLEKPLMFELQRLGYAPGQMRASDGQVSLDVADEPEALAYALMHCSLHVRTAERCQLELFSYRAEDFERLFDEALALPWEHYIPDGARFTVKGYSRKSKLFGVPAIQRLLKKAVVRRLLAAYGRAASELWPEDPARGDLDLRFALVEDRIALRLDASGEGLHKRGYRIQANEAPIRESLAAAILDLMRWRGGEGEAFIDPFCGSGTFAVEAALVAAGIPVGLRRRFAFEDWFFLPEEPMARARHEAQEACAQSRPPGEPMIFASDIDPAALALAENNARRAGVEEYIHFEEADALSLKPERFAERTGRGRQLIVCNPPYGARMSDEGEVRELERRLGGLWLPDGALPAGLRWALISADEYFEQVCGYRADKRRKLYNGMIKCYLYRYFKAGKRPRISPRGRG